MKSSTMEYYKWSDITIYLRKARHTIKRINEFYCEVMCSYSIQAARGIVRVWFDMVMTEAVHKHSKEMTDIAARLYRYFGSDCIIIDFDS